MDGNSPISDGDLRQFCSHGLFGNSFSKSVGEHLLGNFSNIWIDGTRSFTQVFEMFVDVADRQLDNGSLNFTA